MIKAFVSYSHFDDRKKQLLEELLVLHQIKPIIVTNRDDPNEWLSEKVKKSIIEADYLIPILTKKSVINQWVNQEIGYAQRLLDQGKIIILPILEKNILNRLNQFINKHQDLPYHYTSNKNIAAENKAFKKQCLKLINYIKKDTTKGTQKKGLPKISKKDKTSKSNFKIYSELSHLSLRQLRSDNYIELNSSMIIENEGAEIVAIKEIELTVPYTHYDLIGKIRKDLVFKSDYYTQDGKNKQYLHLSPVIIDSKKMGGFYKLFFVSRYPIILNPGIERNEYRNSINETLKSLKSIEVSYTIQKGKKLKIATLLNRAN